MLYTRVVFASADRQTTNNDRGEAEAEARQARAGGQAEQSRRLVPYEYEY
jgi:hypothetical protein